MKLNLRQINKKSGKSRFCITIYTDYNIPCPIIALATFINPAILAPFT